MYHCGQEECDERRNLLVDLERGDGGMIDVPQEKVVHGPVPIARELVPGHRVPPVGVEAAVGEEGELGEDVEDAFPDHVPGLGCVSGHRCMV